MKVMESMSDLYDELGDDEEVVAPAKIGLMLVDWTDPTKTVYVSMPNLTDRNSHLCPQPSGNQHCRRGYSC